MSPIIIIVAVGIAISVILLFATNLLARRVRGTAII